MAAAVLGVVFALAISGLILWSLFTDVIEAQFDGQFTEYTRSMIRAARQVDYEAAFASQLGMGQGGAKPPPLNAAAFDRRLGLAYGERSRLKLQTQGEWTIASIRIIEPPPGSAP